MSRSGLTNFDSDSAFDYFGEIAGYLKRELEYWIAPEYLYHEGAWLLKVLTVLELMLLFEQYDVGHSVYIHFPIAIQRWRSIIMPIWDSEWEGNKNFPLTLDDYAYRQQHRPAIESIFNRLESIALYWESDLTDPPKLSPLLPDYPLPYFSIIRTKPYYKDIVRIERFTRQLIEQLVKDIIYWLSPEKRSESISINIAAEEVPAAAEVLSFICEMYEQDLGVNDQAVRNWRDTTLQRMREFEDDLTINWDTGDERLKIIKATFDQLEAIAQKYPPENWLGE